MSDFICLDCEKRFNAATMPSWADEYRCPFCGSDNVEEEGNSDGGN